MEAPIRKHRLAFMQAMRGVAAALVVIFHSGRELSKQHQASPLLHLLGIFDFGVDIFFIISGFIMYYVTYGEPAGGPAARDFLFKRINRVVPMYWLFTTLFILPLLLTPSLLHRTGMSLPYILSSYVFIPWQRPDDVIPSVSPVFGLGWTLNFEMLFYLVFAVLIGLRVRSRLAMLAVLFAALYLAGRFVAPTQPQLFFWTRSLLLEFVAGAAIAAVYCRKGGRGFLPAPAGVAMLGAGLAIWLAAGLLLPVHDTVVDVRGLAWGAAAALVMAGLAWSEPVSAVLSGGRNNLLQILGDASFSLYLCHLFVVRVVSLLLERLHLATPRFAWLFVAGNVVAAMLVAVLVYRLIERPLTKLGGRLLLDRPARMKASPLPNPPA